MGYISKNILLVSTGIVLTSCHTLVPAPFVVCTWKKMSQTFWVPGTWSATLNSVVPQRIFQVQRWKWNLFEAFHRVLPPCFLHLQAFPRCSYRCLLFQQTGISMFYIGNQKHVDFLHLFLCSNSLNMLQTMGFPKALEHGTTWATSPPSSASFKASMAFSSRAKISASRSTTSDTSLGSHGWTTTGKGTVPQNHGITIDYNLLRDHWATQNTITIHNLI